MSRISSRTIKSTLRLPPSSEPEGRPRGRKHRKYDFHLLMKVSVHHSYYNIPGRPCPDFQFAPTSATRELMRSLGLLFRDEGTGFSVLYDKNSSESLLAYLAQQVNASQEVWSWLSFTLTSRNVYFINFTDVNIGVEASEQNFYFSNQKAHERDAQVLLNPAGEDVGASLLPVLPVQVSIPLSKATREVEVRDISGEVLLSMPRCVPSALRRECTRGPITRERVEAFLRENPLLREGLSQCTDTLYVDFAHLPGGRYLIEALSEEPGPPIQLLNGIYEPRMPSPLCFIDLLFAAPSVGSPGIYPVRRLLAPEPAEIIPVHYMLLFERRSTRWRYYIVPPAGALVEQLRIVDPEDPQRAWFDGPTPVKLDNDVCAYRFTAREQLALELNSRYRFQLRGRRSGTTTHESVLRDRLPVASAQKVLPRDECSSDIFVYL